MISGVMAKLAALREGGSRSRSAGLFGCMLAAVVAHASPAQACTATGTSPTAPIVSDLGSYSPPAVKAGAVPALRSKAGLTCDPSLIVVLGINYIKAKFKSDNVLKLVGPGGHALSYVASADPSGSVPFTQNGTVDYMQNNLLNVLGLLGGSSAELPFFVRPASGTLPPAGTYKDRVTIVWDWYLCPGIGATPLICLGTPTRGTATSYIDISVTVAAKQLTITTQSVTRWDPVNFAVRPRAVPGSRRRATISVTNPDLVAMDLNSVSVVVPIAAAEELSLAGDGTSPTVIAFADGSPASGLTLTYAGPDSTADDVDFSADGGASWGHVPVAGAATPGSRVTNVRLRPRGAMAAGSSFSVQLATSVR